MLDDTQEVSQGDRSQKRVLAIQHKNQLLQVLDILLLKQRQLTHKRRAIPDELQASIGTTKRSY